MTNVLLSGQADLHRRVGPESLHGQEAPVAEPGHDQDLGEKLFLSLGDKI